MNSVVISLSLMAGIAASASLGNPHVTIAVDACEVNGQPTQGCKASIFNDGFALDEFVRDGNCSCNSQHDCAALDCLIDCTINAVIPNGGSAKWLTGDPTCYNSPPAFLVWDSVYINACGGESGPIEVAIYAGPNCTGASVVNTFSAECSLSPCGSRGGC